MEINTQLSGTMALLLLSIFTHNTQACYYEGDPVWTGSQYDVPAAVNDASCYYSGDPVQIAVGQYDNPTILVAENSYYTADEREVITHASGSESASEFSAFEDQDDPAESSKPGDQNNNDTPANDDNNNWTPGAWDQTY